MKKNCLLLTVLTIAFTACNNDTGPKNQPDFLAK
ncbi:MAG: hypothetical protein JWQ09_2420, partial [Segetibacter sp.]|nr:hypothetical protein [Segetibacter sp.]